MMVMHPAMTPSPSPARRRWVALRPSAALGLLAGLFAMHALTVGHMSPASVMSTADSTTATVGHALQMPAVSTPPPQDRDVSAAAASTVCGHDGSACVLPGGMNIEAMAGACVAVLTGLGLALLARSRGIVVPSRRATASLVVPRRELRSPAASLASLGVLRI